MFLAQCHSIKRYAKLRLKVPMDEVVADMISYASVDCVNELIFHYIPFYDVRINFATQEIVYEKAAGFYTYLANRHWENIYWVLTSNSHAPDAFMQRFAIPNSHRFLRAITRYPALDTDAYLHEWHQIQKRRQTTQIRRVRTEKLNVFKYQQDFINGRRVEGTTILSLLKAYGIWTGMKDSEKNYFKQAVYFYQDRHWELSNDYKIPVRFVHLCENLQKLLFEQGEYYP